MIFVLIFGAGLGVAILCGLGAWYINRIDRASRRTGPGDKA